MKDFGVRLNALLLGGLVLALIGFGSGVPTAGASGLTFVVGGASGQPGTQVLVPVQTTGFSNVNSLQFSFHWTATDAAFVGVEQFGLTGLAGGSFGTTMTNNGTLTVSWDDPDGTSANLPNGTTLFMVRFQLIGAQGNMSSVFIDGTPTPMEAADGALNLMSASTVSGQLFLGQPNTPPVLAVLSNKTINEFTLLAFRASAADVDVPAQTLTFSLDAGAPAGASIDPVTGVFTWTPTEGQGPSTSQVTIRVTDSGLPPKSAFQTITISVNDVNVAPVLAPISNNTINEGSPLSFTVSATDSDLPAQILTYSLGAGAPVGSRIDPVTGLFTWTPSEAQGGVTYSVTMRVTDNGSPVLSASQTISITVNKVNSPPVLTPIGNKTINELTLLAFTVSATDSDLPVQTLTYSLDAGAPPGTSINPLTGAFTWTPTEAQGPGIYPITIRVTDNGSPIYSVAETINVTVNEVNIAPVLAAIANKTINEETLLTFTASATDADLPPQTLSYSLDAGAPVGASIDPVSGVFTWTPTEAQGPSTNWVTVRVTDNGPPPLSAFRTITIVVNEVNVAPVLAPISNKTINAGNLLTFTVSATDHDIPVETLTYSLGSGAPTGATIGPSTGVFTWTPTKAQGPATYPVTIRVTDNGIPSLSATQTISIVVTTVNTAPVLSPVGNKTIDEGTLLSFTVSGADADVPVQTLTYSLDAGAPAGVSINPVTGLFTWTPTEAQGPGTYPVTIRVTDNGSPSASAAETISITVNEVNSAPVLAAIGNKSVNKGSLLTFTVSATDPDIPAQTLTYSLAAGAPSGAGIDPISGVFTWVPTPAQGPSTNSITIQATDNGTPVLSASQSITVTVYEVNIAPVLAGIGNKTINESSLLAFTASATDANLPAQTLTFSLDAGAPAGASIDPLTGLFTWTPTEAQGPGVYPTTVRVTDNGTPALSASETITITVNEVNTAPVLPAIGNKTGPRGSLLTFIASATDADLPAQTLSYSLGAGAPAGASINPITGVFAWTPTQGQGPSTNSITIRVTDNGVPALSASRTFTVTVTATQVNTPPVLMPIGNKTINEGSLLTFTASGADEDLPAQILTYSLDTGAPAGATIAPSSGVFSWTPTEPQGPGAYLATIRVTDNGSPPASASETITITVNEVNTAPVLPAIADKVVDEGTQLTFTVSATDADLPAQILTYTLDAVPPAGAIIDPLTGIFSWTPTEAQGPGAYPITIRVTDNGSPALSAAQTFNVTVNEVNTAPILAPIGSKVVDTMSLLTFTATATDADLPAQVLTYSLDAGAPVGASIAPATGRFTWTPTEAQGPASYSVTIRVTDSGFPSLSASETITITVNGNTPPVLAPLADQTVNAGSFLTFTAVGSDADIPTQTLTYSLSPGAPAGASINPNTGVFTWTPGTPGTNQVTIGVTDNGSPPASASATITINVRAAGNPFAANRAPVLAPIGSKTVNEETLLTFKVSATDPDLPAQTLTYSLDAGAPAGASIDPATGVFSWVPTEVQGPSIITLTIRVTDNGSPALSAFQNIIITVFEVNKPPVLTPLPPQTINEETLLTFTAFATDPDIPAETLTYSLGAGAPLGASINPVSGVFSWIPTEAQGPSTNRFSIRVTDSGIPSMSASQFITITVNEVNSAPVLAPIGNITINELTLLTFKASATDRDLPAQILTYSLDAGAPAGATINPSNGVLSWIPSEAQGPGTYPVTVRVTDNGSPALSAFQTFVITVNEVNSAPILAPIGNKTIDEQTLLTFTVSAFDADIPAQTLTYSLAPGAPAGASIDPITGVFTWMPTEVQGPSIASITFWVKDDGLPALSASQTIRITVNEVNTAPMLAPIGDKTIDEQRLLTFKAVATDADLPVQVLTYSLGTGAPPGASINPTTGIFTWTPTEAQGPGVYPITIRVTDNGPPPLSSSGTFTVTVNEVNTSPVLAPIGNKTINEQTLLTFKVLATDADLPAQALTYSLDAGAPQGASIDPVTGIFSWIPTEVQGPSTITLTIRVTDNGSPALSAFQNIVITVNEVNRPPVLAKIDNQTVNEGDLLIFRAFATDPDIPAEILTYSLGAGAPVGASINPTTGIFTWVPTEAQGPSTNLVTIRVTDSGIPAMNASQIITIIVHEVNSPPVLAHIGNKTINENTLLTFRAIATDPDLPAQILTFSLDPGAPAGATINPTTGIFNWIPTEVQGPSTNLITVRVTDNFSAPASASETITVTVNEVNVAPVLAAIGNRIANEGIPLTFNISATDADLPAQILTYSLGAGAPAGASIDPATGVFTWTPTEAQGPATYPVTFVVTDNGSPALKAAQTITITVKEVNTPPALAPIGDKTINEMTLFTFKASATDSDLPAQILTYSLDAGAPPGASISPTTGVFTWTPTEAQGPGVYAITIRVTDNGSPAASASQTIAITVKEVNAAPVLAAIANKTINELTLLTFKVSASDSDLPAQTLTYSLDAGAPAGAAIDPVTGVFSWIPTEVQGPSTITLTIRVTDNGSPALTAFQNVIITVNEVNAAPVLAPIADQTINKGNLLTFTASASDSDIPAETLTYTLVAGAPAGASIHPTEGIFTWTPSPSQGPGTNSIAIRVTDNGLPSLSATQRFTVTVMPSNSLSSPAAAQSALAPLFSSNVTSVQSNGIPITTTLTNSGRVVVLGNEPFLEALPSTNQQSLLILHGLPGTAYVVESTSDEGSSKQWQTVWSGTMTNLSQVIHPAGTNTNRLTLFRASRTP